MGEDDEKPQNRAEQVRPMIESWEESWKAMELLRRL